MRSSHTLALVSLCALAGTALAQPKLVITATTGDLAADGNTVVGWVYDGAATKYAPFKYTRGIGFTRITGFAPGGGSTLSCSADGSILSAAMDNTTNWEGLNCFPGYDANGVLRVLQNPCYMRSIAHRYTAATGWVNAGSLARTVDPATGRMIGGTNCDATINNAYDISGNGRYIVGGAYSAVTVSNSGGPASGNCGKYYAFRYDSQTGAFDKLPTASGTTLANRVNADGSVVTGYDLAANGSTRQLAVWTNGVETILDPGAWKNAPVNGPGTVIAAGASSTFCLAQFGIDAIQLVKWTRSGANWVPQNLGAASSLFGSDNNALVVHGISDDGNTIVGDAYYGGDPGQFNGDKRPFICRPDLNEGVPTDLINYLATLDPTGERLAGTEIALIYDLSADGNTITVAGYDTRSPCAAPSQTLNGFFAGMLSIDGSAVGNEPPSIAMHPVDRSTRCEWPGWGEVVNITAGGSWPLNYQWQREDPNTPGTWVNLTSACSGLPGMTFPHDTSWQYEGVNGAQLRVNVVGQGGGNQGRYRCVVSNDYGSVASNPATLTFEGPINPLTPAPATGCANSPATFSVGTVPGGVEYRWEICTNPSLDTWAILTDGTNTLAMGTITVSGTRTPTMTVNPGTLPATQTYSFRCHIADSCNTLDSNPGVLTIGSPCGPADVGAQGGVAASCGDGLLDNNDFVVFIDYFFSANPRADLGIQGGVPGNDGQWDNNDFIVFIDYFFNGCN